MPIMRNGKFSEQQIIAILKAVGAGTGSTERFLLYGVMQASDIKRLRELESAEGCDRKNMNEETALDADDSG